MSESSIDPGADPDPSDVAPEGVGPVSVGPEDDPDLAS
jgi:hypothetical protein